MRFNGRPIDLPDGTHVGRRDVVGELHFHNATIALIMAEDPRQIVRVVREDLVALGTWAQQAKFPADLRAIWGVTILSRAGPRLGFTVRDRPPGLHTRLERFFMTGLMVLYHPQGVRRLLHGSRLPEQPREVWMSRGELLRRYGQSGKAQTTLLA
jgi:hypothetical protein